MNAQELALAKQYNAKGYLLVKGNPSRPLAVNCYSVCRGNTQQVLFAELLWDEVVSLIESLPLKLTKPQQPKDVGTFDEQELTLAKQYRAKGYVLIKLKPEFVDGPIRYKLCQAFGQVLFEAFLWDQAVELLKGMPDAPLPPPTKTLITGVRVVDTTAIPDQAMVEAALLAHTNSPSRYMNWYTGWRLVEGSKIRPNSEEHTALSRYLITFGCALDEWVILETSYG